MSILFFHDAIARLGGLERVYIDKINYLANYYNANIYLITTCQGEHPITYPLSEKVKHIDLNIRFHIKYQYPLLKRFWIERAMNRLLVKKLNALISYINPDIIIATTYHKADIVCKLKCNAKKIIESHSPKTFTGQIYKTNKNVVYKFYKKWMLKNYFTVLEKKSDMLVALTDGDAKDWNTKKVTVIPNIVDIKNNTYSAQINKTAMFAGRFSYEKGLDRMLRAWKIVTNKQKDWILKLVGDGELKEQLIDQCKKLGIENNVIFTEATKDIASEYINSSLFLFTSRFEGFGLVLVEAMQCGLPCISFDCPYGPYDIIDNGINGYIIKNGNIQDFANAVLKLIEDDELRKEMAKAAIEKSKEYLPDKIMQKWIDLFNRLINEK